MAVREKIGRRWEGEVFKVNHKTTGIEYAAKSLFPSKIIRERELSQNMREKCIGFETILKQVQYHIEESVPCCCVASA